MYRLQDYNAMTGMWDGMQLQFDTALDALEQRDIRRASLPNDGVNRGVRVVDDSGKVIEYS